MKITIEQVKADIRSGKSKMIYYSSRTLWWTHLHEDVLEASKAGEIAQDISHKLFMERTDVSEEKKQKVNGLYNYIKSNREKEGIPPVPSDPAGAPLMQMADCMKWIETAEAKPEHFGKHGLHAFISMHHQNMPQEKTFYDDWFAVNAAIDDSSIWVCSGHPEYKVPLICTMAFPGSEVWCPYCGANLGTLDKKDEVKPATLELEERFVKYRQLSREYLRARSISVCSETLYEGEMVSPMDLPLKERKRIQAIVEEGWQLGRKVD